MNSEGSKAMDRLISTPGNVRLVDALPPTGDSRSEVMNGLRQAQKTVDPKWFYDARGSALFVQITALTEYYPTRTEIGILRANKPAIARR